MIYSEGFRESAVQKLLKPGNPGLKPLAATLGVSPMTLRKWRDRYADAGEIKDMTRKKRPQDWSAEEKLKAVLETSILNEEDRGAYCRRNGLYDADLELWKELCLASMRKGPKVDVEKRGLKNELKEIKRDLRHKEKALAEASALLILKKKADLIWGDGSEDGGD